MNTPAPSLGVGLSKPLHGAPSMRRLLLVAGAIVTLAGIGEPNVVFNQAAIIQKTGATVIGANPLTATILGNAFSLVVPLSLLPSTGFTPENYGWNLWPRTDLSNNTVIADFAPNNAL